MRIKPLLAEPPSISVIIAQSHGDITSLSLEIPPRSGPVWIRNELSGRAVANCHYRGNAFHGMLWIPFNYVVPDTQVFVKLNRRPLFFDESGWIELSNSTVRTQTSKVEPAVAAL